MTNDKKPVVLKDLIAPEHLLQAIDNSLMHSGETAHGVTGVHFAKYAIVVQKRKGLSWIVELKFKTRETAFSQRRRDHDAEHDKESHSNLHSREDGRKEN